MEAEEEDYFNADDDEDEILPVLTTAQAFPRAGANALKRKRARGSSIPQRPKSSLLGAITSVRSPSIPPLGGLVDYGDDDDLSGLGSPEGTPLSPRSTSLSGLLPGSPAPQSQGQGVTPGPRLLQRQIPSKAPPSTALSIPEDEEDSLLESLLSKGEPPSPSLANAGVGPIPGLKRRREEDDDELLALANKSKRQSVGFGSQAKAKEEKKDGLGLPTGGTGPEAGGDGQSGKATVAAKGADEGPKKIKLKLASSAIATPTPSSTGAKDGDTG